MTKFQFCIQGQLGNQTQVDSAIPVDFLGLNDLKGVATGAHHTCVITKDDKVKCWGQNRLGELGNNSKIDSVVPVEVVSLTNVKSIFAGGRTTCAIDSAFKVYCWGRGTLVPSEIQNLSDVKSIAPFWSQTCALPNRGIVKCWSESDTAAIEVPGLIAKTVSVGFFTNCAIDMKDNVYCWGKNTRNALGYNSGMDSNVPVKVVNIAGAQAVAVGADFFSCALLRNGSMKCWSRLYFPVRTDQASSELTELFKL